LVEPSLAIAICLANFLALQAVGDYDVDET
jgi:hypothetical protein